MLVFALLFGKQQKTPCSCPKSSQIGFDVMHLRMGLEWIHAFYQSWKLIADPKIGFWKRAVRLKRPTVHFHAWKEENMFSVAVRLQVEKRISY